MFLSKYHLLYKSQCSSLVGSFKQVSKVVPDALKDMVDNSEHVNGAN